MTTTAGRSSAAIWVASTASAMSVQFLPAVVLTIARSECFLRKACWVFANSALQ